MDDAPETPASPPAITLSQYDMAKLAREVAMDMYDLEKIIQPFGLTRAQYDALKEHPVYDAMLRAAEKEWKSASSTTERIRVESAAILEEALPHLGARMMKREESLAMQVQAGQLLAKLAGISEQTASNPGEKFSITIDLGGDTKLHFERDRAPTIEAQRVQPAKLLQEQNEKNSIGHALQQNAEGEDITSESEQKIL